MGRVGVSRKPFVIRTNKKKMIFGKKFTHHHILPPPKKQKIVLRTELKRLAKVIKGQNLQLHEMIKRFGKRDLVTLGVSLALTRSIADYSEIRWKLAEVVLGETRTRLQKQIKQNNAKEVSKSLKQIQKLETNVIAYEEYFNEFRQKALDMEEIMHKKGL